MSKKPKQRIQTLWQRLRNIHPKRTITMEDLQKRVENLKKIKDVPKCKVKECENPVDGTEAGGWDTCCPYHRLLWDFWLYEIAENLVRQEWAGQITHDQVVAAHDAWVAEIGKEEADAIVLDMANDPINWVC